MCIGSEGPISFSPQGREGELGGQPGNLTASFPALLLLHPALCALLGSLPEPCSPAPNPFFYLFISPREGEKKFWAEVLESWQPLPPLPPNHPPSTPPSQKKIPALHCGVLCSSLYFPSLLGREGEKAGGGDVGWCSPLYYPLVEFWRFSAEDTTVALFPFLKHF